MSYQPPRHERSQSVQIFTSFLSEAQVSLSKSEQACKSLADLLERVFDRLEETVLRALVSKALEQRNLGECGANVLGPWSEIIDGVRNVTIARRERATGNFERLVAVGRSGDLTQAHMFLSELQARGQLDRLLTELVGDAITSCEKAGQTEYGALFRNFAVCIAQLRRGEMTVSRSANVSAGGGAVDSEGEALEQKELMRAGIRLNVLLKECDKDAAKLKRRTEEECAAGKIDQRFLRVLDDNITACVNANYENKVKVLRYMREIVVKSLCGRDEAGAGREDGPEMESTTHHAPRFVDEVTVGATDDTVNSPESFIAGPEYAPLASSSTSKSKQKQQSKASKRRIEVIAGQMSAHLSEHGWAVCDSFLPLDLVRRVRIETEIFKEFFEQSEIWVGKQSDVGAQLSVPSVRGDKVLWMCGGHSYSAPEGITRHVKTKGELEPCKLKAKAHAPVRKFAAIKETVEAIDGLIAEMRGKVPDLTGIYERSDAMFAVYPGEGSRFARHIDNTTRDGRRLTVLLYLNPEWTRELGGALRLTSRLLSRRIEENGPVDVAALESKIAEIGVEEIVGAGSSSTRINDLRSGESLLIDVFPNAGRLAVFYSSEIAHEVMPSFGERHALTVWYYDLEERQEAVKAATETGRAAETAKAGERSQAEAKQFIGELMGGDEIGRDGGDPTVEELVILVKKVEALSDAALGIVASITGAPSVDSFRAGFKLLVPADLKSMRQLFRRMGLT